MIFPLYFLKGIKELINKFNKLKSDFLNISFILNYIYEIILFKLKNCSIVKRKLSFISKNIKLSFFLNQVSKKLCHLMK